MKTKIPVGKIDHDKETKNPVAPNEQEENRLVIITKACGGFILICQSQITTYVRTEDLKIWQFFVLIVVVFCRQALLRLLTAPPPPQLTLTVGSHSHLMILILMLMLILITVANILKYPSLPLSRPARQLYQLLASVPVC